MFDKMAAKFFHMWLQERLNCASTIKLQCGTGKHLFCWFLAVNPLRNVK